MYPATPNSYTTNFATCKNLIIIIWFSYESQGFRFFSRLVGRSDPWSKKWWVIFWNDGPKHIKLTTVDIWVVYFTYTLTQTLVCTYMYIDCWLYSKTCHKRRLKKEVQLSLNAGQKYCRMLQGEHSATLLTFIKLPFVVKIFVLSFLSGCLRHVLLYWPPTWTFCFVEFVDLL